MTLNHLPQALDSFLTNFIPYFFSFAANLVQVLQNFALALPAVHTLLLNFLRRVFYKDEDNRTNVFENDVSLISPVKFRLSKVVSSRELSESWKREKQSVDPIHRITANVNSCYYSYQRVLTQTRLLSHFQWN